MSELTPTGSSFQVNSYSLDGQGQPSAIALAGGHFVVTWTHSTANPNGRDQDTSYSSVWGQILNADGTKVGGEFLVNTTTSMHQYESVAESLPDGRFVVVWTDSSAQAGDLSDRAVRLQVFNADGSKSGGEALVNTTTLARQVAPAVAVLADGGLIITWEDTSQSGGDTTGAAIRAQRFDSDMQVVGQEFLVNSITFGRQFEPEVAALSDGGFVICWTDESGMGGDVSARGIRGRAFAADGQQLGDDFLVNTETENHQTDVRIRIARQSLRRDLERLEWSGTRHFRNIRPGADF